MRILKPGKVLETNQPTLNNRARKVHSSMALTWLLSFCLCFSTLNSSLQFRFYKGNRKKLFFFGPSVEHCFRRVHEIKRVHESTVWTSVFYLLYFILIWWQNRKARNIQHLLIHTVKVEKLAKIIGDKILFGGIWNKVHCDYCYLVNNYHTNYVPLLDKFILSNNINFHL